MRTLVLGIGNPILGDDVVGIKIAREINKRNPDLEVIEASEAGLALLDHVAGYDKLIIIDSIKTKKGKPGSLYKLKLEELKPTMDLSLSHSIDIATAFKLGEGLGYKMPRLVSIYAVEMKDNTTFGENCSQEVERRMPSIVKQIMKEEELQGI